MSAQAFKRGKQLELQVFLDFGTPIDDEASGDETPPPSKHTEVTWSLKVSLHNIFSLSVFWPRPTT